VWSSHRCPEALVASPCPLMGGLHPKFSPGPTHGQLNGWRIPDAEYWYLAGCAECENVLWRKPNGRLAVWIPEEPEQPPKQPGVGYP
jgi:hypothetical protein